MPKKGLLLTVVGRLNLKKVNFFLQNLHMTTILDGCQLFLQKLCMSSIFYVECQELIQKLITVL